MVFTDTDGKIGILFTLVGLHALYLLQLLSQFCTTFGFYFEIHTTLKSCWDNVTDVIVCINCFDCSVMKTTAQMGSGFSKCKLLLFMWIRIVLFTSSTLVRENTLLKMFNSERQNCVSYLYFIGSLKNNQILFFQKTSDNCCYTEISLDLKYWLLEKLNSKTSVRLQINLF